MKLSFVSTTLLVMTGAILCLGSSTSPVQAHDICPTWRQRLDPFTQCQHTHFTGRTPVSPNTAIRVTICNAIPSTATFFLNSELKSMEGGKCGAYTLPVGSQFRTSYAKDGRRIQVLVNLEEATYNLTRVSSGDIELRRR